MVHAIHHETHLERRLMADGIPCAHCGHQEGSHRLLGKAGTESGDDPIIVKDSQEYLDALNNIQDSMERWLGYTTTLQHCEGYEPQNPERAKTLAERAADKELRQKLDI